ncbi:unnamed protein product [Colias eurytheme]|nr:unnamed protein product [Colias eurytheme]
MITLYYQNVRGLRTKTNDLYKNILLNSYDVIVLSETWLNCGISSSEIFDSRYIVYRRDRICNKKTKLDGGGVLIAVARKLQSSRLFKYESEYEDLWVNITCVINGVTKNIPICAIYLPPPTNYNALDKFIYNANNVLEHMENVIILGDFNLGNLEWAYGQGGTCGMVPIACHGRVECALVDFINLNNLEQINNITNQNGKILDLALTNIPRFKVSTAIDILTKPDPHHPCLFLSLVSEAPSTLRCDDYVSYNFFKADYDCIVRELENIDWCSKFANLVDINDKLEAFYDIMRSVIDNHVPKSKMKKSKYPPWFTSALIHVIKDKEKMRLKTAKLLGILVQGLLFQKKRFFSS